MPEAPTRDPFAAVPEWAVELLDTSRIGRLGTADAAARPLVVPVCYVFDRRVCYSAVDQKPKRVAARQLRRIRNIEQNPHVSLVVDEYDEDWSRLRYVIVEGGASVVTGGPELTAAVDLLVAKYPQYRALELDRSTGIVLKIVPARVLHWRFTRG